MPQKKAAPRIAISPTGSRTASALNIAAPSSRFAGENRDATAGAIEGTASTDRRAPLSRPYDPPDIPQLTQPIRGMALTRASVRPYNGAGLDRPLRGASGPATSEPALPPATMRGHRMKDLSRRQRAILE